MMTPERREEIEVGQVSYWQAVKECFKEIDRLKEEYGSWRRTAEKLKEENRRLREAGATATTFLEGEKPL